MRNTVTIRTGLEGPRHDPYHYEEVIVNGRNGKTVLHRGLSFWITFQHDCSGPVKKLTGSNATEREMNTRFERQVGVAPDTLINAVRRNKHNRVTRHLKACGAYGEDASGYPGESFVICEKCGAVLDSHFDRKAVE